MSVKSVKNTQHFQKNTLPNTLKTCNVYVCSKGNGMLNRVYGIL